MVNKDDSLIETTIVHIFLLPLLELEHLSLLLLLASELEMLATLDGHLVLALAISALQTEDDLLGGLGLLSEDGLGLTSVSLLLAIVTPLALGLERILAFLVLRDLVQGVFSALGSGAEGAAGFGDVHHFDCFFKTRKSSFLLKIGNRNFKTDLEKKIRRLRG